MDDAFSDLKMLVERGAEIRPMSSDCPCDSKRHDKTRPVVFEDGWLVECLSCGARWVEYRINASTSKR